MNRVFVPVLLFSLIPAICAMASPSRVKDIAVIEGQGRHKLLGYGIVAGLEGTGDGDSSLLTARSMANLLEQFGVTVNQGDMKAKNLAAVIVTAEMPAIVAVGSTVDVTVASLADARSLQGGMLLLTPLKAANGEVYATAQGPITIGGFSAETRGGDRAQKNHPTVGRVPGGASVVKALTTDLNACEQLTLLLLQPDFTTALRIAEAINKAYEQALATALNQSTVQVTVPTEARGRLTEFIVGLEALPVEPDAAARVVINERTGTVVIGAHVRIMPVAICHGGLSVEVKSETQVSQPPPLVQINDAPAPGGKAATASAPPVVDPTAKGPVALRPVPPTGGQTVVTQQQDLSVTEAGGQLVTIPEQATLEDLVTALDALGVKPRDLIAIIQALKEAGALRAELVLF